MNGLQRAGGGGFAPARRGLWLAGAALAAALTLAACGSSGPGAAVLTPAQYGYILNGGAHTPDGQLLFEADQLLRARCMSRAGFRYVFDHNTTAPQVPSSFYPQPGGTVPSESSLLAYRRVRGFDLYGEATAPGAHTDPDPDDRYLKTLPPATQRAWLAAWDAGPGGGCLGRTGAELYGSRANAVADVEIPAEVYDHVLTVVDADPQVVARTAAWSSCMQRAAGHRWANESALVNWIGAQGNLATLTSLHREIRLSVQDTRCAYSTGQAQTMAPMFVKAANHLPSQLEGALLAVLAQRAAAVRRAEALLGPGH